MFMLQICNLSSDLNVVMRMTDAAASDRNETVICIIYLAYRFAYFHDIFTVTVDLCTDATPSLCNALPVTHTLSLSLCYLALFSLLSAEYIIPWHFFLDYHCLK
jgi:hypothetical protein